MPALRDVPEDPPLTRVLWALWVCPLALLRLLLPVPYVSTDPPEYPERCEDRAEECSEECREDRPVNTPLRARLGEIKWWWPWSGCNVLEAFEAFEFLEALEACFSITPFAEEAAESSPG